MALCAKFFQEDIYVVDRRELIDLSQGHVSRNLGKKNPFFQKFGKNGGAVTTVTLADIVEALKTSEKTNIVEHNGLLTQHGGHFAAYRRTKAPHDTVKQLMVELDVKEALTGKKGPLSRTKTERLVLGKRKAK